MLLLHCCKLLLVLLFLDHSIFAYLDNHFNKKILSVQYGFIINTFSMQGLPPTPTVLMTRLYADFLLILALQVLFIGFTMAPIRYSKQDLLKFNNHFKADPYHDLTHLRKLGICSIPTHRGCRGSGHRKTIQTVASRGNIHLNSIKTGVNLNNLVPIAKTSNVIENKNTHFKLGLLNARSVKNKSLEICDHIVDNSLDLVAITETWMSADGVCSGLSPAGFDFLHSPRTN